MKLVESLIGWEVTVGQGSEWRRWNITTQERKVCDVEIEIVSFVVDRSVKSSLRKFYGRYGDLIKHYEVSLSQMLHDILGHDHVQ